MVVSASPSSSSSRPMGMEPTGEMGSTVEYTLLTECGMLFIDLASIDLADFEWDIFLGWGFFVECPLLLECGMSNEGPRLAGDELLPGLESGDLISEYSSLVSANA